MAGIERSHCTDASRRAIVDAMQTTRWNPDRYDSHAAFVARLAADLVDLLAPRPGERVLDLGCGTGALSAQIARAGAAVVGLDASAEMVEAARQREPSLRFVVGDAQALPFEGEFDAVFSNAALHWMPRAADVAAGVARSLRPGGRFVAELGGKGCIDAFLRAVSPALAARGEDPAAWVGWYFPDVAEYVGILTAAGLEVKLAHLFDRPTPVAGSDGLREWLRTFRPGLETRLGDGWSAFVREVEERCSPALRRDDGWVLDYVRLRVVATRRASG
jgi:trans-aconitate methyltransferase